MSALQHAGTRLFTTVGILAALVFTACDTDFLNTEPLDSISSDATWADGALSEAFIYNVYSFLGRGGFDEQMLASLSDEALFTHTGRRIDVFNEGNENPANIAWTSGTYAYSNMYQAIRQANTALQELPNSTFPDTERRDRLMGEAYFLRAYYYHQLARYYGGVPLISEPYSLDDDYTIARSTWAETVDFIISDLDQAITLLGGKAVTRGRASQLSAQALKARVLLYAASDEHQADKLQAASSTMADYGNIDLVAYTSGDQRERWSAARTAALEVLQSTSGYKTDLTEPVSIEEGIQNHISIPMGGASAAGDAAAVSELIFERSASPLTGEVTFGMYNGPNGYHNWAGNTPTGQLVDDYEMMDGSTFDWDDPADAAMPYENRDPRFYAHILYDGADWKPRPADVVGKEPYGMIQTGYYADGQGGEIPGVDTRESSVENWNGSRTHYYMRKFIDPDPSVVENTSNFVVIPWPFIRYTEMMLNYVEASLELDDEDAAREWLNRIRFRAGMPAVEDTGEALVERYRNERRIELAYEEHRYHDARRWLIAEETQGQLVEAIDVRARLKAGKQPHTPYYYDPETYDYTYEVFNNTETETRSWDDKMFFRPIDRNEINRNPELIQNPGY